MSKPCVMLAARLQVVALWALVAEVAAQTPAPLPSSIGVVRADHARSYSSIKHGGRASAAYYRASSLALAQAGFAAIAPRDLTADNESPASGPSAAHLAR